MLKTKIDTSKLRTWLEIDRAAIKNNYEVFRRLIGPKVKLMAVVKSNAYGHGLVHFAEEMVTLGADYLGVDSMVEALRLREEGIVTPILVLGFTRPANFSLAAPQNISLTISSLESLDYLLANQNVWARPEKLKIQLKVDTGMHRQGFLFSDFPRALDLLKKLTETVEVVGVFSHLAGPAFTEFQAQTEEQIATFQQFLQALDGAGFSSQKLLKHLAATGGALAYPAAHHDLVRIGLGLYGLWPSRELEEKFGQSFPLQPALTWQTIIGEVKTLDQDGAIGYEFTEDVRRGMAVAICPIGYWHGFRRHLSSIGEVLVRGERAKVLGRVSMDMIAIDVTKIAGVKAEDVVTIIGQGSTARHYGDQIGTSQYEIITGINPLIKKFYV